MEYEAGEIKDIDIPSNKCGISAHAGMSEIIIKTVVSWSSYTVINIPKPSDRHSVERCS